MLRNEDGTVQKRYPDHAYRDYLYLQRDGLVHHEIADIWSELRMIHQPLIQRAWAAEKKGGGKKKEGGRRQNRQENAENPKSESNKSQYSQNIVHTYMINYV